MVQEAGLDLSRFGAIVGIALLLGVAPQAPAAAQPLLPDSPLATLLQPQKLDRSRPLLPQRDLTGSQADRRAGAGTRASPCERPAPGRAVTGGSGQPSGPVSGGGSGPGEYARYMPGATTPTPSSGSPPTTQPSAPSTAAPRNKGVDRPLYGGNDRPLWGFGQPRPDSPAAKPTTAGQDVPAQSASAEAAPESTIPAPVRDRPLWADRSLTGAADPMPDDSANGSPAALPCPPGSLLPQR